MTDEIRQQRCDWLKAAINQAIDNGWLPPFAITNKSMTKETICFRYGLNYDSVHFDYQAKGHIVGVSGYNMQVFSIIYRHDFAHAL